MEVTPDLLSVFPLLRPLPPATLTRLASCSWVEKFSRRGIVLDPNKSEAVVCFLFEGKLQGIDFTVDGREVGLYFVDPGDFCGEAALFDDLARPEYVVSLAHSVAVKVPSVAIQEIMSETPSVMNLLGNKLATRIRQLTFQRSLLAIPNVQQRVCCQLWMLCKDLKAMEETSAVGIVNPPTHLEIANMLSVSRESVTRVFQTLQNRQIVRRSGPSLLSVLDAKQLKNLAEGNEPL